MNFDNKGRDGFGSRGKPSSMGSFRKPFPREDDRRSGRGGPSMRGDEGGDAGAFRSFRPQGIGFSSSLSEGGSGFDPTRERRSGPGGGSRFGGGGGGGGSRFGPSAGRDSPFSRGPRREGFGGGDRNGPRGMSRGPRRSFGEGGFDGNRPLWIYGEHPSMAAIANPGREILEAFVIDDQTKSRLEEALRSGSKSVEVQIIDREELESKLPRFAVHQGIVLRTNPIPLLDVSDLLRNVSTKQKALIVMLDGITDPHNFGAIVRSAASFGVDGIIVPKHNSCRENPALLKAASGAYEIMTVACATNLNSALKELRDAGFWCFGLDGEAEKSIQDVEFGEKVVLVIGSEGDGMRELVSKNCDENVKIDIDPQVSSLNASVAASIALYVLANKNNYNPAGANKNNYNPAG